MGSRKILLTGVGKHELEISIWVPDNEERAIKYLNEAYPRRWKDADLTLPTRNMRADLEIAKQEESETHAQLLKLQKRAARSLEKSQKHK